MIVLVGAVQAGAGSGNAAITHGLSIQADDVILALLNRNTQGNIADNNGAFPFTQDYEDQTNPDDSAHAIFSRVASASEPATYNFTTGGGDRWSVQLRVYRGVDTANIYGVIPATHSDADDEYNTTMRTTATVLTTTDDGEMAIAWHTQDDDASSQGNPDQGYGNILKSTNQRMVSSDKLITPAGTLARVAVSTGSSADGWAAHHFTLRPAAEGPVEPPASVPAYRRFPKFRMRRA